MYTTILSFHKTNTITMAVKQEPIDISNDDQDFLSSRSDHDDSSSLSSMTSHPVDLTLTSHPTNFLEQVRPSMVVDPLHDDVLFLAPAHRRGRGQGGQGRRQVTEYETYSIAHHEEELNSKQLPKKYRCRFCVYKTSYKSDLNRHLRKHGIAPQHCPFCNMPFKTAGNLENHIRITHGISSPQSVLPALNPLSTSPTSPLLGGGGLLGSSPVISSASPLGSLVFGASPLGLDSLGGVAFPGSSPGLADVLPVSGGGEKERRRGSGSHHSELQDYPALCQVLASQLSCHVCPFVCNDSTVLARHILAHPPEEEASRAAAALKASSGPAEVPVTRLSCSNCGTFVDSSEELQAHRRSCLRSTSRENLHSREMLQNDNNRDCRQTYKRSSSSSESSSGVSVAKICVGSSSSDELQNSHQRSCHSSSSGDYNLLLTHRKSSIESPAQSQRIEHHKTLSLNCHSVEKMPNFDLMRPSSAERPGLPRQETLEKLRKTIAGQKDSEHNSHARDFPDNLRNDQSSSIDAVRDPATSASYGTDLTPQGKTESRSLLLPNVSNPSRSSNVSDAKCDNNQQNSSKTLSTVNSLIGTVLPAPDSVSGPSNDRATSRQKVSEMLDGLNLSRRQSVTDSAQETEKDKVNVNRSEKMDSVSVSVGEFCESGENERRGIMHREHNSEHTLSSDARSCTTTASSQPIKIFVGEQLHGGSGISSGVSFADRVVSGRETRDDEDVVIKEEPTSPDMSMDQQGNDDENERSEILEHRSRYVQGNDERIESTEHRSKYVASLGTSVQAGHERHRPDNSMCVLCERAFPMKSTMIRHLHEAHGLPLRQTSPRMSTAGQGNYSDMESHHRFGSGSRSLSPIRKITNAAVNVASRGLGPTRNIQARSNDMHLRSNRGKAESSKNKAKTAAPVSHTGEVNAHQPSANSPQIALRSDIPKPGEGFLISNPQATRTTLDLRRQHNLPLSRRISLNPRVSFHPPSSGRYAKLESDFDRFAAQPYACSLCFFRTARLGELRAHVHNHLTGCCSIERVPETARLAQPENIHHENSQSGNIQHVDRATSPLRLSVQEQATYLEQQTHCTGEHKRIEPEHADMIALEHSKHITNPSSVDGEDSETSPRSVFAVGHAPMDVAESHGEDVSLKTHMNDVEGNDADEKWSCREEDFSSGIGADVKGDSVFAIGPDAEGMNTSDLSNEAMNTSDSSYEAELFDAVNDGIESGNNTKLDSSHKAADETAQRPSQASEWNDSAGELAHQNPFPLEPAPSGHQELPASEHEPLPELEQEPEQERLSGSEQEPLPASEQEQLPAASEQEPLPAAEQEPSLLASEQESSLLASEQEPLPESEQRPLPGLEQNPLPTSEQEPLLESEHEQLPTSEQNPLPDGDECCQPSSAAAAVSNEEMDKEMLTNDVDSDAYVGNDIIIPADKGLCQKTQNSEENVSLEITTVNCSINGANELSTEKTAENNGLPAENSLSRAVRKENTLSRAIRATRKGSRASVSRHRHTKLDVQFPNKSPSKPNKKVLQKMHLKTQCKQQASRTHVIRKTSLSNLVSCRSSRNNRPNSCLVSHARNQKLFQSENYDKLRHSSKSKLRNIFLHKALLLARMNKGREKSTCSACGKVFSFKLLLLQHTRICSHIETQTSNNV